jgi:O-antigen/teichoic acid export membrane protein
MTTAGIKPILSLGSQTIMYGFGSFGRMLVGYITIPFLTTYMGMEAFGVVAVLISMLSFFDMISNAGLPAATFRLYNDDNDSLNQSKTLGSAFLLFVIFAVVMGIIVWFSAGWVAAQFLGDAKYTSTVRIIAILLLVTTLLNFIQIVLRIQIRPKAKALLDMALIGAQVSIALVLVILFSMGSFGYWLGYLLGAVLGLIFAVWLIKGTVRFDYSRQRAKELLHYGLPLMPAAIGLWGLRLADRSIITANLGLTDVAVYEVGYKVGMITALVLPPFLMAWPQFAFSRIQKPDAARTYRNVLTAMAATIMFLAIFVISFRSELVALMAPAEYAAASVIVPWIALSQVAWALYPVLSIGPKIVKNTALLSVVAVVACLVNLGLNYFLIPRHGIIGAAIATLAGYWVLAVMAYIVGNKYYLVSLDWRRLAQIVIAVGITLFVVAQTSGRMSLQWQKFSIKAIGLTLYPMILVFLGFVSREQLHYGLQIGFKQVRKILSG